jgi:hypothetical protein
MSIVTTREFDGKLPPAWLYLDDIEQIVEILTTKTPELFRTKRDGSVQSLAKPDVCFKFIVGEHVCDTVEELRQLGDSTHDLRIHGGWCDLDLSRGAAEWRSVYGNLSAEVHGLLLQIFGSRHKPASIFWGTNRVFLMLQGALDAALLTASPILYRFGHRLAGAIAAILSVGMLLSYDKLHLPYSTIYLRRKRDPLPESARWMPGRQELVRMALSAIVGVFVGWLIGRLNK